MRLLLFVGVALISVQIPSFVDQYGQRLDAHQKESKLALSEFQKDADKFFAGDLAKLVAHYKRNNDPVFNDGGDSIAELLSRYQHLNTALGGFDSNIFSPYLHTLVSPLEDIRKETWSNYDYSIKLNVTSIIWALIGGLFASIFIDLIITLLARLFGTTKPNKQQISTVSKEPQLRKSSTVSRTPPKL